MLAVIRIRGRTGIKQDIEDTAHLLRLNRINHLVLLQEDAVTKGMLQKVKDYVTWGEIDVDTLEVLLKNRCLFKGRRKLTEEELKDVTGFGSYRDLAKALVDGKIKFSEINDVVPVIRLNPPYKGYEAIKTSYRNGGSAGYRGKDINNLIRRMIIPGVDLNGQREN
ncbi:ribosomal protein large subunit L7 [Thermoplasma volcanium GSS1]|uniref:Large ribosomal subunit protein uL30 n=1 Tax=Thermoplasma volcanium (strain ATCC 51530 / DSM 4299 / JCM 9571 / NBRC 15438 / GSS1) TaxID=273116 RepID=RL30_THEVO|nr:50S ribosomal protein L30 [Thermoplasma volcanium]Q97BV5.1 RecName: Full=Large ribosomal subunit protein uL30; AltName: Full=50S ribosomal protein L30 [Thermoplasma volcanium GSS1]BAB59492.1 ribosomal protein large subunit L7 [Thermoplasma volcanium GSS1]